MPLPPVNRVVYRRNPLAQVICQLRFTPILRIDSELPAKFQERLREVYPLFQESVSIAPVEVAPAFAPLPLKAYEFKSDDEKWGVSLTREFLALTTLSYERWEMFSGYLRPALEALIEVYHPAYFTRVGLRYQNIIRRSDLAVGDAPWSALLQPTIAAELNSNLAEDIMEAGHGLTFSLESMGQVRVQHGLVPNLFDASGLRCYLIDNDFFAERRTEVADVWNTLNGFNAYSRRLFRWCITDQLHRAMEPEQVE